VKSEVSIYYDPMISKLAAWGRTRREAIDRLRRALDEYQVAGIKTTLPFFREVVLDQEFISGRLDTGFIARFNARREATRQFKGSQIDEQQLKDRDVALIAAALRYAKTQKEVGIANGSVDEVENRWKMSGRSAMLDRNTSAGWRNR
jgi:acetyl/propionyl-CoA carboxylase alpha subunit